MENFLLPLAIPSREVNSHALYSPTLIRIACRIGTTIRLQIKSKLLHLRLGKLALAFLKKLKYAQHL